MIKTYSELSQLDTFEDRYQYLKLNGAIGEETFGFDRFINQNFYKSPEWKAVRDFVIVRDNGCDLGVDGYEIRGKIYVHHINPILLKDIVDQSDILLDPEYLISPTHPRHNAIHYGDENVLNKAPSESGKSDTCPWRRK